MQKIYMVFTIMEWLLKCCVLYMVDRYFSVDTLSVTFNSEYHCEDFPLQMLTKVDT